MAFVCQMPCKVSCQVWAACYQFTNQVTPIGIASKSTQVADFFPQML